MTPEDFTVEAGLDGEVCLVCPFPDCRWESVFGAETLRWVLDAARDHLDDKEANHG